MSKKEKDKVKKEKTKKATTKKNSVKKVAVKDNREAFLRRSANEAKNYHLLKKILKTLLIILVIVVTTVYIASVLYSKFGSYTVTVNKFDAQKYSLSLSEDPNFDSTIITLNSKAATEVTNISGIDLPKNLDTVNGEHNGDNYLAYTYYLKNIGDDTVTYEYNMFIANVKNNVDSAIRIRLYVDGVPVDYAETKSDGTGAEDGTTEFLTNRTIVRNQIKDFKPGDITKFTVVIWLEGNDADCSDELIGGSMKTDMTISVIEASGDSTTKASSTENTEETADKKANENN